MISSLRDVFSFTESKKNYCFLAVNKTKGTTY